MDSGFSVMAMSDDDNEGCWTKIYKFHRVISTLQIPTLTRPRVMTDRNDRGPVLVRSAVSQDSIPTIPETDRSAEEQLQTKSLKVSFPEDVLTSISENTGDLQEKLNKFVNAMNSKIQSVWLFVVVVASGFWVVLMVVDESNECDGTESSNPVFAHGSRSATLHRDVETINSRMRWNWSWMGRSSKSSRDSVYPHHDLTIGKVWRRGWLSWSRSSVNACTESWRMYRSYSY